MGDPKNVIAHAVPKKVSEKSFSEESLQASPAKNVKILHKCMEDIDRFLKKISEEKPITETDKKILLNSLNKAGKIFGVDTSRNCMEDFIVNAKEFLMPTMGDYKKHLVRYNCGQFTDAINILSQTRSNFSLIYGDIDTISEKNTEKIMQTKRAIHRFYEELPALFEYL
jgi:hypothetical protein